ncbi:phage tail protein [Fulvimarina endophytica]|uniref:Phage tail protein n=1 Tax=Fulvimarina endophytica TaxID=2293836 RepID=A0A371X2Y9_9HYPH|nr:phage tail sheath subtilisin-like domain-containing protein [Fulvimarina endophytica]RFC63605.1 phage tail protein [Fulvimarina endophytica]
MLDFQEIPYDWLEPGTYLEVKPNYSDLGVLPYPVRNLIAAQKLATGTLAPGQVVEITRPGQAEALFGRGSLGAEMIEAFKAANRTQPLFVTALADAAGSVKATGTLTFAGALAAATVLRFRIADRPVRITATAADDTLALAVKLAAAINAETDLIVTAAAAASVVTVTSRHGGEVGNDIDLRVDVEAQPVPAGLSITVGEMAGGAGNPDITDVLDLVENDWYTAIGHPWSDATNIAAFEEDLRRRYEAMSKLDCHGYVFKRGTYGQLSAFGDLANSPFLTFGGLSRSPTSSWVACASLMAICSFHLANDPARQLRSLVLKGVGSPAGVDQFTETENDLLLRKGISTFKHLPDGTVTISRIVTTYKVSNLGVPDRAWLDIMVPATMSRIRYDWAAYVSLQYPRAKLIDDEDSAAFVGRADEDDEIGTSVVTPRRMKGTWAGRCRLYADRVWIERVDETIRQSVFERDEADKDRMNARQPVQIVGNLMVLAGSLEFLA